MRVDDCMPVIPNDAVLEELGETAVSSAPSIVEERFPESQDKSQSMPSKPPASTLQQVFDLHTLRRMKASISTNTSSVKPRAGIGILCSSPKFHFDCVSSLESKRVSFVNPAC
ncbi:hypothetical protein BDR05DRAFT_959021 [Suillus weaverae]|nr:hypothetical protein BDR05DRAFT_959021 [Suillus weaverae]